MEGVVKQWKEAEAEVEEEVGLLRRQAHVHVDTITTITTSNGTKATEHTHGISGLNITKLEFSQTEANSSDIEKEITLDPSDPLLSVGSTSLNIVTNESERVGRIAENLQELYLERLYQKLPTQGFYCPNCKACIQKVLIQSTVWEGSSVPAQPAPAPAPPAPAPAPPAPPPSLIRCPSCLSFLIPIGRWLFPGSKVKKVPTNGGLSDGRPKAAPGKTVPPLGDVDTPADQVSSDEETKASNEEEDHKTIDTSNQSSESPQDDQGQKESRNKLSRWGAITGALAFNALKKPKVTVSTTSDQPQLNDVIVLGGETEPFTRPTVDANTSRNVDQEPRSSKTWDILKSIVYGGLIEYIASLGIVTSAASADATTLSILALSVANLITGLCILIHNIWDLKSEQQSTNGQTNALVDRYYKALGRPENFILHLPIAILSFLIFGLIPPLVYCFTFYESNDKDLKLAAVAGASVLCITLLSMAKTHIQRPKKYLTYLRTVLYYLSTGAMASVVSYIAGELISRLVEKLGWFDSASSSFNLILPEMIVEKPRFGSY